MNRRRAYWVPSPDEESDRTENWLRCRLAAEWFCVDGDRAILPVTALERGSEGVIDGSPGLLVQYGGADLILDATDLDEGDEFHVVNPQNGRPYIAQNLDTDED